jgi:glycosyltransferase involved in cell wall biosynthesis
MKILIVAFPDSIHTARWISQLSGLNWDIRLFPSTDYKIIHPDLKNIKICESIYRKQFNYEKYNKFYGIQDKFNFITFGIRLIMGKLLPNYRQHKLKRVIETFKPDIIHSMEIQHAGYLTLGAKKLFNGQFPKWIVTNWGSDIYLFGQLSEHEPKIRKVLSECDFYSCECHRDVNLAKSFGFKGQILPVFPNAGGFDLEKILSLRQKGPISGRHIIMLKGYQGWAGRALVGLRALERCSDLLRDYQVVIYSSQDSTEVKLSAELFSISTGIPVKIVPIATPHQEILKFHEEARISIGLSISDAISTSLLEAMAMGSFPIQSYTSCANEWIQDGKTGLLVPPEDPDIIEGAIRRALTDDELVNLAAEENWKTVVERLDHLKLKKETIDFYRRVLKS